MFEEFKMYDDSFARRIDIAITKIGGEKVVNAQLNLSAPTLGRWKDGTSDPKMSNMIALAQLAQVSLDWLLIGKGDESTSYEEQQSANDDIYDYVPVYDVQASAGHGMFSEGATKPLKHLAFRKDWLAYRGFKIKDLAIIYAEGDSMEPTIPDGSTLVIDCSLNIPKDGKIYIIRIDERLYVKRIQWLPTGLRLISDNKELYDPIDLTKDELKHDNIEIIGQVVHTAHDLP